jgi:YD repeat-containing protein
MVGTLPATGTCAVTLHLIKMIDGTRTVMAEFPYQCHDGMTLGLTVRDISGTGTRLTVTADGTYSFTATDSSSPIASGKAGVGLSAVAGSTISKIEAGAIDHAAPAAVPQSSIAISAFPNRVELQWQAATDDAGGSGVAGYQIARAGVSAGTTTSLSFTDTGVTPVPGTTYTITPYDRHGNTGTAASVTVPAISADARRIGVRPTGSYWGASGEQIDLVSGNLNFALPLLKPQSRGGWGTSLTLSYNSQLWRQDSAGVWKLGRDVGYGFGWTMQAGSVLPVMSGGSLAYCIFTGATGVEYRMDSAGGTVYATHDGVYLWYDSAAQALHFPDGSWWDMLAQSAAGEDDAGTLHPTAMHDSNGNYLTLTYQAGAGTLATNTSARIVSIQDPRRNPGPTYWFTYTAGVSPHLANIMNYTLAESYTFTTSAIGGITLTPPFGSGSYAATMLQSVATTYLGTKHQFTYNASGELTQVTTPLAGDLRWAYRTYTYSATGRSYREVTTRQATKASGAAQATWNVTPADGAAMHGSTTLSDLGANSTKVWTFDSSARPTSYEERGPGGAALVRKDYTWNTENGNVYVGTVLNTINPGSS